MMLFPITDGGVATEEKADVAVAVEVFRSAVVNADENVLTKLLDDDLSYGHSDGHVEGKRDLITKLLDGTYDFVTMDFSEQHIQVKGSVALVRNRLDGKTNDAGKPNEAHLYVLMVWLKTSDGWKLLARQAVKRVIS